MDVPFSDRKKLAVFDNGDWLSLRAHTGCWLQGQFAFGGLANSAMKGMDRKRALHFLVATFQIRPIVLDSKNGQEQETEL
jgi:hypothetical protein